MAKFDRVPPEVPVADLSPLDLSCNSTKCGENLHAFKLGKRIAKKFGKEGVCHECGADLVDWNRVHKNNIRDSDFVFQSMKQELIRHVYWHMEIDPDAIEKAKERGTITLRERAKHILSTKVSKVYTYKNGEVKPYMDGQQTPKLGSEIIHYAQHATATCCRTCLAKWHNIENGRELTEKELKFCIDLIMLYIEDRVEKISKEGTPKIV